MIVGIIGAGSVAQAFARHLLAVGHEVVLSNSRGPETLSDLTQSLGKGATAATMQEASSKAVVVLAVPWLKIAEALASCPPWAGRILIDATNEFLETKNHSLADLGGRASSEYVADAAPGAKVVKAVNNLIVNRFEQGAAIGSGRRITFISGDDVEAKLVVRELLESFGFAAIDLGSLHEGGRMQQASGPLAGLDLVKVG